ncbi:hypothetical protein T492DRAFT_1042592 [Pavlovales sp. CCMP2436]|nr:hypothetical protein T492DRAFT_1042592 [Pavlovales sp. CCMP2436]
MHAFVLTVWLLPLVAGSGEGGVAWGVDAPRSSAPTMIGDSSLFVRSGGAEIQVLGAGPTGERCFPLSPTARAEENNTPLVLNLTAARTAVGQPTSLRARRSTQEADYILLCACPKAASLTLRSIATASRRGYYRRVPNIYDPNLPFLTKARDRQLLYGHLWFTPPPLVRRLIFVRHPVARILHGSLQLWPKLTETQFDHIVFKALHRPNHPYDSSCGRTTQAMSSNAFYQHFVPPQHCRCGLPCGAAYEVVRIEDSRRTLYRVLLGYGVPAAWLPSKLSTGESSHSHGHGVSEGRWLNERALSKLNNMTSLEQGLLGYRPYRIGVSQEALLV